MPVPSDRHEATRKHEKKRIDEHEHMLLAGADREAFLEAALKPPAPTDKLVAALRRHRSLTG